MALQPEANHGVDRGPALKIRHAALQPARYSVAGVLRRILCALQSPCTASKWTNARSVATNSHPSSSQHIRRSAEAAVHAGLSSGQTFASTQPSLRRVASLSITTKDGGDQNKISMLSCKSTKPRLLRSPGKTRTATIRQQEFRFLADLLRELDDKSSCQPEPPHTEQLPGFPVL